MDFEDRFGSVQDEEAGQKSVSLRGSKDDAIVLRVDARYLVTEELFSPNSVSTSE